jgi:DsrE/DsrF-like family.
MKALRITAASDRTSVPAADGSRPRSLFGRGCAFAIVTLALALSAGAARAQGSDSPSPFATHHLVLQASEASAKNQSEVLNVANNTLKYFGGPDHVAIEVVAFAGGVSMLYADSKLKKRVDSLIDQGVRFDICMETIHTIERETHKTPKLNPRAHEVANGVPAIMKLVEKHYVLVKP